MLCSPTVQAEPCDSGQRGNSQVQYRAGRNPNQCGVPCAALVMEFLVTVTPASTSFVDRHIGARRQADVDAMLKAVGYDTVDALVDTAVPKDIRQDAAWRSPRP